jgi:hypothetical protein
MRVYGENVRRRQLRLVECRPHIERLEHYVIRPLGEADRVLDAVEDIAILATRLDAVGEPVEEPVG